MRKKLDELIKKKTFLIVSHRGLYGANIIDNTLESVELAFRTGADIVEIDVIKSTDNILYAFHSNEEFKRFNKNIKLSEMSSKEIENLEYLNVLGNKTGKKVDKIEDILKFSKGKGLINLDRAWDNFDEVFKLVKKLNMEDEVIVKSPPNDEYISFLKNSDIKLMYMPILDDYKDIDKVIDEKINLVAVELLFKNSSDKIISNEYINKLKNKNIHIWANSIELGGIHKLQAGYSDDFSLFNDGKGWEWLYERGFNIIQTDWPFLLYEFRNNKINGGKIK
ncbi:glycerophosphodiester phosphodiesterase family protein [Oceanivirga salmonicida]|uniref:glycerophosphodiester phosphodiesterase family protein n=1 Tax=Oceanivirga salmonicida TaxID=1769291 RepID=UPI0008338B5F|nr:glycerophosphodiester phosphodiesterase family protein [Oceanivirga salmonicida]